MPSRVSQDGKNYVTIQISSDWNAIYFWVWSLYLSKFRLNYIDVCKFWMQDRLYKNKVVQTAEKLFEQN